jgi:hypothetical protein
MKRFYFNSATLLFNQQKLIVQTTWAREIPFAKTVGKNACAGCGYFPLNII